MGFFFDAPIVTDRPQTTRSKPAGAKAQRKIIAAGAKGCDACVLKGSWPTMTSPKMKMTGPKDASILILGGYPTQPADQLGVPHAGWMDTVLKLIPGRERDIVAHQNVVRCLPLKGDPDQQTLHACSIHLDADVEERPIKYVLGVGSVPLIRFWPGQSIQRVHGTPIPVMLGGKPVWYFPIMDPFFVEQKGGMRTPAGAALKADINRFFRDRKSWGKPIVAAPSPSQVIVPETYEQAKTLVDGMRGNLGIDLETSKLKPYEIGAELISGAISDGETTIAFPCNHPERQTDWGLRLLLETVRTRRWVAHNAGFELAWLRWLAGDEEPFAEFEDSQAQCRIYYERETIANLETCSMAALGVDVKALTGVNSGAIMEYPLSELLPYNGLDAWASAAIDRRIGDRVQGENYTRMVEAIHTTAIMELKGLPISLAASKELRLEWQGKVDAAIAKSTKLYEVRQFEITRQKPFRLSANEDIGTALVEFGRLKLPALSKAGTYKTDDDALAAATKDNPHPLVEAVLEYRTATKTISTYTDPIEAVPVRYVDGMLHPSYTVLLTSTARLSSNDPNIQNFPKRKHREIRRQIVPPKNHLLVAIDYGQLEWRIAAMASRDNHLCQTIIEGVDAHAYWRDYILEREPDYWYRMAEMSNTDPDDKKATLKGGRNLIKTDFVFASVFGSSAASCAERTGIPLVRMQEIQGEFWTRFRGVKEWHKKQRREYDDLALVRTLTGRVRRGLLWGNEPINTPIQGTAADIVVESMNAMRKLSAELKEPCLYPRINIHDDLTFFLPDTNESELMEYIYVISETLTEVRHSWQIVPLTVEVSIGENWADLEEVYVHTGSYNR